MRKLIKGLLLVFGLAAGGLVCRWLAVSSSAEYAQTLQDGAVISVTGITYGTPSSVAFGSRSRRLLYQMLPPALKRPVDPCFVMGRSPSVVQRLRMEVNREVVHRHHSTNAISFWLSYRGGRTTPNIWVVPVAPDGNEFGPGTLASTAITSSNSTLLHVALDFFPRRDKAITLRFYEQSGQAKLKREPVAEIIIPNPALRDYPKWTATKGPITVQTGPDEFTLTRLVTGVEQKYYHAPSHRHYLRAEFNTRQTDGKKRVWSPKSVRISDSTGNIYPVTQYSGPAQNVDGGTILEFPGSLSPDEPVHVEVNFSPEDGFPLEELWELKDVALPEQGSYNRFQAMREISGVTIEIAGISSGGTQFPNWGVGSSSPLVLFRVASTNSYDSSLRFVLVNAMDALGQSFLKQRSVARLGDRGWLNFNYPPQTRTANLVFAVSRAKAVNFTILPSKQMAD